MATEVERKAGFVKFQNRHQPTLPDGDYEIKVKQVVGIEKHSAIDAFTASRHFTVTGERFALNPTDIESVFPPNGNLGDHNNVLPHVTLSRSTLPWERTANAEQSEIPWLALLVFDEDEKPEPKTMTAGELQRQAETGIPRFPKIKLESAQQPEDLVTVIDVPYSVLSTIMPSAEELTLLTHVRFGTTAREELTGDELAIIIAHRLPQPNKTSFAHLVSVEGRFKAEGTPAKPKFHYDNASGNDLIRLVSLKSWSFACESSDNNFKQLLVNLNKKPSTLRLPAGAPTAQEFFSRGYVAVPHHFRGGHQSISWFRGPLIPDKSVPAKFDLPAHTADELVRYDASLSMFDVSYAAAWELGRLLALQDKDFSTSLYQWKRQQAQRVARNAQRAANLHLPFQSATQFFVPEDISGWFKSLRRLEGVPFNYLVPDERMLPPESIRFFRLDRAWLDCLADGAFSIGRVASSDLKADKSHGARSPAAGFAPMLTGFLLRSEVVSGWPGLLVDGFSDTDGKDEHRLINWRMDRLAPGVLLCMFAGTREVARVDIYQKPETLHFGFSMKPKPPGGFFKKLRDSSNGTLQTNNEVALNHWHSPVKRTIDVVGFGQSVSAQLSPAASMSSRQFGLQMVESGDKIIFLAG